LAATPTCDSARIFDRSENGLRTGPSQRPVRSCVANPLMFRFEKGRQQAIDLQQTPARERDFVAAHREHAVFFVLPPDVGPLLQNFDAEFATEITGGNSAGLHQ